MNVSLRRMISVRACWCCARAARRGVGARRRDATPRQRPGTAPTVDGVVNAAEWADATSYTVAFGALGNATVRFLHTATDLYVGVVVQDPNPGVAPSLRRLLRRRPRRREGAGRGRLARVRRRHRQDFFCGPDRPGGRSHYQTDDSGDGTNETAAAGTIAGGDVMFEFRHPLCTGRHARHLRVGRADARHQLPVPARTARSAASRPLPAPTASTPADWADLTLGPRPTTTRPAHGDASRRRRPGSVVSGTITVAADASDNVGVASVEFRYFDGEGAGVGTDYSLGVDTTRRTR